MMALKYNCPQRGHEIISRNLGPGDRLPCPACKSEISVPVDALQTDESFKIIARRQSSETIAAEAVGALGELVPQPDPTPRNAISVLKLILAYAVGLFLFGCVTGFIVALVMAPFYGKGEAGKELYKADFDKVIIHSITFMSTPVLSVNLMLK